MGGLITAKPGGFTEEIKHLLLAIRSHDSGLLRQGLQWHLARLGLLRFVSTMVAGLTEAVGREWAQGRLSVWEEHFYSEQLEAVLRVAIAGITPNTEGPKILITTLPGEMHRIGLLMVEALVACEHVRSVSLGSQTPLEEITDCVQRNQIDIVALSFSQAFPMKLASAHLTKLRDSLPSGVAVWAGGRGVKGIRNPAEGITAPMSLSSIAPELQKVRTALAR